MSIAEKLATIATNMELIKNKVYDDTVLKYLSTCESVFYAVDFPEGYIWNGNVGDNTTINEMFVESTGVEKIIIRNNKPKGSTNMNYAFTGCSARIIDLSGFSLKIKTGTQAFYHSNTEEIIGELDLSTASTTAGNQLFVGANNLVEVRFKAGSIDVNITLANSPLLSDASIQSVIDGLKSTTTSRTLTLSTATSEKLTEEQTDTILGKGWSL